MMNDFDNSVGGGQNHQHVPKKAARKSSNPKYSRATAHSSGIENNHPVVSGSPSPPHLPRAVDDDDLLATSELNNMMMEEEEEVPRVVVTQTQMSPSQQLDELNLPSATSWNTTTAISQTNTQQQPFQQLQRQIAPVAAAPVAVDRVNGKGMWRSWTRSFNTPLLALLDLFDNAVDASMKRLSPGGAQQGVQPAHVSSNGVMMGQINPMAAAAFSNGQRPYENPKIAVTIDDKCGGGILIRNSCESSIPPMKQVLEVYKSSKKDAAIGENGIGCKHACANLSTLSILMSKTTSNNSTIFSIGIVMEELQKDEGVILPSARFDVNDGNLRIQLSHECSRRPDTWGVALTEYGEGSLEDGLDRINFHFNSMMSDETWTQYDHVFTTLITKLRHRGRTELHDDDFHNDDDENNEDAAHYEQADNNQLRSTHLLRELAEELPRLYIHIHSIDVSVQHIPISKLYWEKRLVEITQFDIPINPKTEWKKDKNAFNLGYIKSKEQKPQQVRFILGFDPKRARERRQASCRVYLYSRESGRLIREFEDARAMLNLIAGSTDYTQGLTVLVDDYQSTLPLNPTKQDLAFGFNATGQIHQENLWAWTSAAASFFWSYHFERLGSKKSTLTTGVINSMDDLERAFPPKRDDDEQQQQRQQLQVPPISAAAFTTYNDLEWGHVKSTGKIRVSKRGRDHATVNIGRDSVVRLKLPPPPAPAPFRSQPQPRLPVPQQVPVLVPPFQLPVAQPLPWQQQQQHRLQPPRKSPPNQNATAARGGGGVVQQRAASLARRVHSMIDEDYVDDGTRSKKRSRSANVKVEDGLQHHNNHQQQQAGWQMEIDQLKRELHAKNVIIGKLKKDKDEEFQQRKKYQRERNELEERVSALRFDKEDLERRLSSNKGGATPSPSSGANTSNRELETTKYALDKLKKKYERLNTNHMKLMQQTIAYQKRKNGVASSPSSTPSTPTQKNGVAIKNEISSPSSTIPAATSTPASSVAASARTPATSTPGISEADYKKLRLAYLKKKEVVQNLERKINSQKSTIESLQSENDNLTQQLKQRDEQEESNLFAAGPGNDDLIDNPTGGVATADVTDSDDVADASSAIPQLNGGDPPIMGNGDDGMNFDSLAFMEL